MISITPANATAVGRVLTSTVLACASLGISVAHADLDGALGIGLTGSRDHGAYAVDTDAAGNLYVAGRFSGPFQIGIDGPILEHDLQTSSDVFLAKLTPDGHHIWSTIGRGSEPDLVADIDVLPTGEVVIVGETLSETFGFDGMAAPTAGSRDAWVALFSSDGTHNWIRIYGDDDADAATSVAFDAANGNHVIVAGEFQDSLDVGDGTRLSNGASDFFLVDLDFFGSLSAAATYGSFGIDVDPRVAVDAEGRIGLVGSHNSTIDFGNGDLVPLGFGDVCLAVFPSLGSPATWSASYGGSDLDGPLSIAASDAGLFVGGFFSDVADFGSGDLVSRGLSDGFVAAYKWDGSPVWSRRMGSEGMDYVTSLDVEFSTLAIAGTFVGDADFGPFLSSPLGQAGGFVATLSLMGTWEGFLAGQSPDVVQCQDVALDRHPIVVGSFDDRVTFGSVDLFADPLDFSGEGFVVRLTDSPAGVGDEPAGLSGATESYAWPNPFHSMTTVVLRGRVGEIGRAAVYDVRGRLIRSLDIGGGAADATISWDGRDGKGRAMPSAAYYLRLVGSEADETVPVILRR